MKRKGKSGGFTLIELIVVLAILAIIAAIAIPVAFKGLQAARDKAARSCVGNIMSVTRIALDLAQLDRAAIDSIPADKTLTIQLEGEKGVFKCVSSNQVKMHEVVTKHFNDSAVQMPDKALIKVEIGFDKTVQSIIYIVYYPEGKDVTPYYCYDTEKNEFVKIG